MNHSAQELPSGCPCPEGTEVYQDTGQVSEPLKLPFKFIQYITTKDTEVYKNILENNILLLDIIYFSKIIDNERDNYNVHIQDLINQLNSIVTTKFKINQKFSKYFSLDSSLFWSLAFAKLILIKFTNYSKLPKETSLFITEIKKHLSQNKELYLLYIMTLDLKLQYFAENHQQLLKSDILSLISAVHQNNSILDMQFKKAIASKALLYLRKLSEYQYLDQDFENHYQTLETILFTSLQGELSQNRHQHIKNMLNNKIFFNFKSNNIINTNKSLTVNIKITSTISIPDLILDKTYIFSIEKLKKFAAHLVTNRFTLKFQSDHEKNKIFIKNLNTQGYCSTAGVPNKKFIAPEERSNIFGIFNAIYHEHSMPQISTAELNKILDKGISAAILQDKVLKLLNGFNPRHAAVLFQACLAKKQPNYGLPENVRKSMQEIVKNCFAINWQVWEQYNKISGWNKLATFKSKILKIAEQIVKNFEINKKSIIIGVGTNTSKTIAGKIKKSCHRFYAAIKFNSEGKVLIFLSNGGEHSERFYTPCSKVRNHDTPHFHHAAIAPFDINDISNKEAFTQYIFNLLVLEYENLNDDPNTDANGQQIEGIKTHFEEVLSNLYPTAGTFKGNNKIFNNFQRQDLPARFRIQSQGNCTVHNLKKALITLFFEPENEMMIGLLDDHLLLSFDQLVSECQEITADQEHQNHDESSMADYMKFSIFKQLPINTPPESEVLTENPAKPQILNPC